MTSFKSYKKCPNCGNVLPKPSLERGEESAPFSIYQSVAAMPVAVSAVAPETQSKSRFVKTMEFPGAGVDSVASHFELDLPDSGGSTNDFELDLSDADTLMDKTHPLTAATAGIAKVVEAADVGIADVVFEDGEIEVEGLGFESHETAPDMDTAVQESEPPIGLIVDEPEAVFSPQEADVQLGQEINPDSALALELDEPEAEPSLSFDLGSLNKEEDTEFSLEVEEPEKEPTLSFDLDSLNKEDTEFSLEVEEPEKEPTLSFDLDSLNKEDTEFSLEVEEPEKEPTLSFDLDSLRKEDTEFSLEAEEPEKDSSLTLDLGSPDKEDYAFGLEAEEPEKESSLTLDLGSPDKEDYEFSLEAEEPEKEPSLTLDLGSPSNSEEAEPLVELENLGLKYDMSNMPDDAEVDPRTRISSLDLNYEAPTLSEEPVDPRSQIESLDLSYETPSMPEESPVDPRSQIESLDLSMEIEATPPQETIEIPEASMDGIKLELEEADKDSTPPDEEKVTAK